MAMTDAFPGFPPEAMPFLRDLAAHNDRDWFNARREVYEAAIRIPAEAFVEAVRPWLEDLAGHPLAAKVFRMHRDVRFSKDKSPYNTHLHIGFSDASPGVRQVGCGFYAGLETDRFVLGAGQFEATGPALDAFRAAIDDPSSGEALAAIVADLGARGFRIDGTELKRTPAPYPADHPRADLLRRKGVTAWRETTNAELISSPALMEFCEETFSALRPLHAWLGEAAAA
jgi:uncharacterized protein (TIGR02453 family)